jgi:transposase
MRKRQVYERAGVRGVPAGVSGERQGHGLEQWRHEGPVTANTVCDCLTRLAENMERKIHRVVDGHRIHKAGKVQKHLGALAGTITLFFLPPYSPDRNADEWVWKQVKQRIARQSVRTRDGLKRTALSALHSLQQMPEKIRRFFRDPACCYAAA